MSLKLGDMLVKQGLLRPEQLAQAIEEQKKSGNKITTAITQLGFLKENQILRAMEKGYGTPGVDVNTFEIDPQITSLINRDLCEKFCLIPIQKVGQTLVVAFSDPSNIVVREDLRFLTRLKIQPVCVTESAVMAAIDKYYGSSKFKQMENPMEGLEADEE
jgi:type IV pilus assembly protein PilB